MTKAEELLRKHWLNATGKELDSTTLIHLNYAVDAINEALGYSTDQTIFKTDRYYRKKDTKKLFYLSEASPVDTMQEKILYIFYNDSESLEFKTLHPELYFEHI